MTKKSQKKTDKKRQKMTKMTNNDKQIDKNWQRQDQKNCKFFFWTNKSNNKWIKKCKNQKRQKLTKTLPKRQKMKKKKKSNY